MRGFEIVLMAVMVSGPVAAQDYVAFKSPSGNIICGMFGGDEGGVRCDMNSMTTQSITTPPADCDLDWGSSFWIGAQARKGELACVSDPVVNPGEGRVLPYGMAKSFGGVSCVSAKSGVTCTNADGHGFAIAKARQRLF